MSIGAILYFAGYTFSYENNFNAPLDIELGRHNTYFAKQRSRKKETLAKKILSILYETIIFVLILWSVPYTAYMAIREKDFVLFGRSWFQILVAFQYYYAIHYFNKNHFYENIICNSKLRKSVSICIPISLLVSLILAIMNTVLLNTGFRFFAYNEIYNMSEQTGKTFISILLFLDCLYSYLTFIINACVFAINMFYHRQTVSKYSENLETYIQSTNAVKKINNIAIEYSQMKTRFDQTVDLLTAFFSVLNFVGFSTLYFYVHAMKNKDMSVLEYINTILFVLTEIIYITSIQSVNTNIDKISDIINSNTLITTFFGNKNVNRQIKKNTHDLNIVRHDRSLDSEPIITEDTDQLMLMMRNIVTTSTSNQQMLDWMSLRSIVEARWKTFCIFGVEFTDGTLISKLAGFVMIILMSTQIGSILQWL